MYESYVKEGRRALLNDHRNGTKTYDVFISRLTSEVRNGNLSIDTMGMIAYELVPLANWLELNS
jgi:hypothetical protein